MSSKSWHKVTTLYDEDAPKVARRLRNLGYETKLGDDHTPGHRQDTYTIVFARPRVKESHRKQVLEGTTIAFYIPMKSGGKSYRQL